MIVKNKTIIFELKFIRSLLLLLLKMIYKKYKLGRINGKYSVKKSTYQISLTLEASAPEPKAKNKMKIFRYNNKIDIP